MTNPRLQPLHFLTDMASAEVHRNFPGWPCRKGCAACCYDSVFLVSRTEAEEMRVALLALPIATQRRIQQGARTQRKGLPGGKVNWKKLIAGLAMGTYRHVSIRCPLLGEDDTCMVYEARPVTCRSFGCVVTPDPAGFPTIGCDMLHAWLNISGIEPERLPHARQSLDAVAESGILIEEARPIVSWLADPAFFHPTPP